MSDRQTLLDIWGPLGEVIVPGREQRKLAAMSSGFGDDGIPLPEVLGQALPAYVFPWYLPGVIATGTNVGAEYELPSMIRIISIRVRVKTAPTSSPFLARLTADGAGVETVSVSVGAASGRSTGLKYIANAGVVLALDVLDDGGAQNVTIVVSYGPASI
jgi:hypothetical protein